MPSIDLDMGNSNVLNTDIEIVLGTIDDAAFFSFEEIELKPDQVVWLKTQEGEDYRLRIGEALGAKGFNIEVRDADILVHAPNGVIDGAEAASVTVHGFVDSADAARVVVTVSDGVNPDVVGQGTVNADGFWQITGLDVRLLSNTNLTFTAVVQDAAGNNSSAAPLTQVIAKTEYVPPLVLDLDGDGFEYTSLSDSGARYDFDDDGLREETAWVGASDALIGFDADGDGVISGREELVLSDYLDGAETDLEGLLAFDTNDNGLFDRSDDRWSSFLVWQDVNGDGLSTADEFKSLDDLGIASLSLTNDGNRQERADGSVIEHGRFVVTYTDGRIGQGADVAFSYNDDADRQDYAVDPTGGAVL